ncbi:MAG: hypothetical protein HFI92_00110 [Lachnospiraceae bacterium]|nr:hypothetical protein [Lachnospiraceae bacterium]
MKKQYYVAVVCMLSALVLGGCAEKLGFPAEDKRTDDQIISDFLTAYQEGNFEAMEPYFDEDNLLQLFCQGQENGGEMAEVYKKAWELTKDFTFTAEAVEGKEAWGEVTLHLQSNDIVSGVPGAMWAAIQAQTENGDDSFSNLPKWLGDALATGEPIDEELTVYVSHRSDGDRIDSSACREMYEQLTGGFYDYIDMTMTTCTAETDNYQIAAMGDSIIGMVETAVQTEGTEGLTAEDVQGYEDGFGMMDGVAAKAGLMDDGSVELRFGVDFNRASSTALANLGVISDRLNSYGGYLSLVSTISSFEEGGMTCETNDFGSGAASSEEK